MNYTTLKAAVDDWLARSDLSDASIADDFIDLAEARINRILRIKSMETVYNATVSNGVTDYPSDALEFKQLYLYTGDGSTLTGLGVINPADNTQYELEWRGNDSFSREVGTITGQPLYATRIGDKIGYWPTDSGTYKVTGIYFAAFTALDSENLTNWLTTNAPDLLLAATLAEASAYIKSPDQTTFWSAKRDMAMREIQDADMRKEYSATPLTQRIKF